MATKIHTHLDRHFVGYARISIDDIDFESGRDKDNRNVTRLVGILERSCERENPANAISVVVEKGSLTEAHHKDLHSSTGVSLIPSQLPFLHTKVVCLHGKHRIFAAREILSNSDRWWIAKIFDSDLSLAAREHIRYEHLNESKFSNGDVLRHHLSAECRGDEQSADVWFARLPGNSRRRVQQLKKDTNLLDALVALLPFAGLWSDFDLGPLNHELAMRCREEQCSYLRSIGNVWQGILGSDVEPHCVDAETVQMLHVLMPAHSSRDSQEIHSSMRNLKAFPGVRSPFVRRRLQARVLSCERILTFKSFHRDMILLEGCYRPLCELFPTEGTTLQSSCEASFNQDLQYFRANYIDLWLRVMRKFPQLSDHRSAKVKKGQGGDTLISCWRSKTEVAKLASFAASCGFWTSDIADLLPRDVNMLCESVDSNLPQLSCKTNDIPRSYRCSRPPAYDFEREWKHLSLKSIYQIQKQPSQKYPTAFAVVRNIVLCFWGTDTPREIENPERLLQPQQYNELYNSVSVGRDGPPIPPCQYDTDGDLSAMQGESQDAVYLHPPTSSRYSDSSRSTSTPTSRRCGSVAGGVEWSEEDFIASYGRCVDTPDFDDASNMQAIENFVDRDSDQMNQSDADVLMALSPGSKRSSPAPTHTEPLHLSPQAQDIHTQGEHAKADGLWQASSGPKQGRDRGERTDGWLRKIKNVGNRKIPHRVEKARHETQNPRLKQQKTNMIRTMQNTVDELRATASPPERVNHYQPERVEMHDAHNGSGPQETVQSHGPAEPGSVCATDGQRPISADSSKGTPPGTVLPLEGNGFDPSQRARQASDDFTEHVQAPSFDVECQWPNNDQDEDVWTGMKKTEEQIRSADDAVGEVYDDSVPNQPEQNSETESDLGVGHGNNNGTLTNVANDIVLGHLNVPINNSSTVHQGPAQSIETPTFSVVQVETSEGVTSRQDKRRAIHHDKESSKQLANSGSSDIGTVQPASEINGPESTANQPNEDSAASEPNASFTRPESLFPGKSLIPYGTKQATKGSYTSLEISPSSRKRPFPNVAGGNEPLNADGQGERSKHPSERSKQKAVVVDSEILGRVDDEPPQGRTRRPEHVDECNTGTVDRESSPLANRRVAPFPGPSNIRGPPDALDVNSNSGRETSQGGIRAQSVGVLKRNLKSHEVEEYAHIRSLKDRKPAQLKDWELAKDAIVSVEKLQHELDQNAIYITSTLDIEELTPRRHRNHTRLWSWSREEQLEFDSQVGALLRKNFRLQMVSSNQHSIPRNYTTVTHMTYWMSHFDVDRSLYWLAILSPEPGVVGPREKVMRT
ncbi:hypothetical protein LTR09_012748 [Extremus antarcticus]|uniref:Uncharacterized protein n=1 Tax=Extremus antarcticus TaxID=702011 RepID=A0AAJ0G912_9PEZI|nr:hypothetical protein LTR09_012748 [Extremus antarcticus]